MAMVLVIVAALVLAAVFMVGLVSGFSWVGWVTYGLFVAFGIALLTKLSHTLQEPKRAAASWRRASNEGRIEVPKEPPPAAPYWARPELPFGFDPTPIRSRTPTAVPHLDRPTPPDAAGRGRNKRNKGRALEQWNDSLVTVWSGAPRTVEFTYLNHKGETLRRKVDVSRISQDPTGTERFYLHGYCRVRKEDRTFNAFNIQTKILDKSQRYDALDWIEKIAGIDPYA